MSDRHRAHDAGPTDRRAGVRPTEEFLLNVASMLGEPVGYEPELGGAIVQNIVPVAGSERQQVSTSSSVTLAWHTETAFHPDAPHYLVLLCRRGDPSAATRLSSIHDILPLLDEATLEVLRSPRFGPGPMHRSSRKPSRRRGARGSSALRWRCSAETVPRSGSSSTRN